MLPSPRTLHESTSSKAELTREISPLPISRSSVVGQKWIFQLRWQGNGLIVETQSVADNRQRQ
jgi:hypothetical protein